MSTIGRAPKDYNAGAWGRIVGRIDKAINTLAKRLGAGEDATRQLQLTQREQRASLTSMLTPEATFEWSEYVDGSNNVYAQCIVEVTRGWAIISDFEYRSAYGNIGNTDTWLSYKTNTGMQFVADSTYKGGGYYLYREQIDFIKQGQTFSVELRGKAANDDVWLSSSHTFDGNTKPEFLSEPKLVLQWYSSTEKWQVRAVGEADDDTASVGFIVSDNTPLDQQASTAYTDFVTGVTDLSGNDKRFNVLLGSFTPSTKAAQRVVWVLAGAFDASSAATLDGTDNFVRALSSIEIPVSPTAAGILGPGDITGEYLADTAKRASVNLTAQHTSGQESTSVTVSGTIQYDGESTVYTINSQAISVGSSGALSYIYFDPSLSTFLLRSSTTKTDATQINGKRIFVGVAKGHSAERAFFVFANDEPVISAPFIYASKLEALTGRMGTLFAGSSNFKIGDEVSTTGSGASEVVNDGIFINDYNYWYDTGIFTVGNATSNILWDNNTLSITGGKINVSGTRIGKDVGYLSGTGTEPTAGEHGIWINADNYWILDTNADPDEEYFKVGDSTSSISWSSSTFDITSRSSDLSKRVQILNGVILAQNTSGTAYLSGNGLSFLDSSAAEYDSNSISSLANFSINIGLSTPKDLTLNPTGSLYLNGDDILLTASGDITLSAAGSAKVDSNAIWHAGNDGAGSGLDADLLDGNHASAFLTSASSISDSQLSGNVLVKTSTGAGSSITGDTLITFEIDGDPYIIVAESV